MAVSNISKKGDTDIFPFPIENALFFDKTKEILEILEERDRNYDTKYKDIPVDNIKTCIPVGHTGFRWATLIDPVWNAFLLAEVLKISEQIENKRIPIEDECVFSYRLKMDEESGYLFDREINWKAFYKSAGEKSKNYKFAVKFDISDFYNRVYHERLQNVLHTDVGADGNSVDRIMGILSRISGRESYGLPVGGNAARILAEALLIRTDNFMKESKIDFCRFVDDYVVFADSRANAYSILNNCVDYFLRSMGLTLQKTKTLIMTQREFVQHVKSVFDEVESDKDSGRKSILNLKLQIDPYAANANEDLKALRAQIDGSGIIALLKSECRKSKINQLFGKQLVKALSFLEEEHLSTAIDIMIVNYDKLYPIFPVVMHTTFNNLLKCRKETIDNFVTGISDLVEKNSYIIQPENNAAYAIRVLSVIDSEKSSDLIKRMSDEGLNGRNHGSDLIRMNAVYAMTNRRELEWLSGMLKSYPGLSLWEKRAMAASASFMGAEGTSWKKIYRNYCDPVENLLSDWTSEKLESNPDWRLPL